MCFAPAGRFPRTAMVQKWVVLRVLAMYGMYMVQVALPVLGRLHPAASRLWVSWEDTSITSSLKKTLYGLKTTEKRLTVSSEGLESRGQIIGE